MPPDLPSVIIIVFLAALFQTVFGFGSALIAMPFLTLTIGLTTASPLVCFVSGIISFYVLSSSWKNVHLASIKGLILGAIFGIPIGTLIIREIGDKPEFKSSLHLSLGIIIILFSAYQLLKPTMTELKSNRFSIPVGFIAGISGGAFNINGPPIVMYGSLKKWDPNKFRASLQAYFAFSNLFIITSHLIQGNVTPTLIKYAGLCIIPIILAMILGFYLNKKIPAQKFNKYIYIILIIIGILFIYKSFE